VEDIAGRVLSRKYKALRCVREKDAGSRQERCWNVKRCCSICMGIDRDLMARCEKKNIAKGYLINGVK